MATITNPSTRPIQLMTLHIIAAKSTLTTTNEVLRCSDNIPMLNGLAGSGQITIAYDPETDADGIAMPLVVVVPSPAAIAQAEADRQLAVAAEENADAVLAMTSQAEAEATTRRR